MDWDCPRILSFQPLKHYELKAIRLRKKSNRYTAYLRCACWEFKHASIARKQEVIQRVFGRPVSVVNVRMMKLVWRCWQLASEEIRDAWDERASYIDAQPRTGTFNRLPLSVPSSRTGRDNLMRLSLQEEARALQSDMRTYILRKEIKTCEPEKSINHSFPQSVRQAGNIYKELSLSPLMRRIIFGDLLEKVNSSYENQSVSNKCSPGFIHFSSFSRANSVFCIEDVDFCSHYVEESNVHFHLTSSAVLTNTSGQYGQQVKCWGWEESSQHITFIYCDENADLPAKRTMFERPILEKVTVTGQTRNRIERVYSDCPLNNDGFTLTNYTPVCLKVNIAKCNVLNVVGSRLAVRIVNNDVFIVSGKEYSGPLFEQNNATNNNI